MLRLAPMAAKRCPTCKLVNPATAVLCDCGWSFVDGKMAERPHDLAREDERQQERRSGANRQMAIGALLFVVGVVITAATYASASTGGGRYVVAYGAIIVGIVKMIRGAVALNQNR
jgi:hypothetical protein